MGKQSPQINVGIDVGKSQLDVYIRERDIHLTVENSVEGIRALLARLSRYLLTRVVLEATGRYERLLADAALAKEIRSSSSIPCRCAAMPEPSDNWPRPTKAMPGSSPSTRP